MTTRVGKKARSHLDNRKLNWCCRVQKLCIESGHISECRKCVSCVVHTQDSANLPDLLPFTKGKLEQVGPCVLDNATRIPSRNYTSYFEDDTTRKMFTLVEMEEVKLWKPSWGGKHCWLALTDWCRSCTLSSPLSCTGNPYVKRGEKKYHVKYNAP